MVDKNDTLLREVDDELRRERMEKLWDQYGIYALGLAGLVVVAVGGYNFLGARQRAAAEVGGAQFQSALTLAASGKADEAAQAFSALSVSDKPGYAALADLNIAAALVKSGKPADAVAAYDKLAAKSSTDPLLTGFAQLQAAGLRLGEADFTEIKNRLTPLMVDGNAWKAAATEMLGTAAIKAGKLDEARAALAPLLADQRLSQTAVIRVKTLLATVAATQTGAVKPGVTSNTIGNPAAPATGAPGNVSVNPVAPAAGGPAGPDAVHTPGPKK